MDTTEQTFLEPKELSVIMNRYLSGTMKSAPVYKRCCGDGQGGYLHKQSRGSGPLGGLGRGLSMDERAVTVLKLNEVPPLSLPLQTINV